MRRTRSSVSLVLAGLLLVATACSDGGSEAAPEPTDTPSSVPTTLGPDQVLEDFCAAAGLVKFMATGADLRLWAQSMSDVERPTDLGGDAAAGLALLQEYAAAVPEDAVAEELEQPAYTPAEVAQLEAFSTYLEDCPQVTDPVPTVSPTGQPTGEPSDG
ncbi:MAG TPA: hypothetical protein VGE77_04410 [Nocardioides sp.]